LGTINGNKVTNLPAGSYAVVIDAADCKLEYNFTITQPQILAGIIEPFDVLCFGESSGRAIANITGGTGDYVYQWSAGSSSGSEVSTLSKGNYTLEVIDENNCRLTLPFEIMEPEKLKIDSIKSTLVSCPNGNDGSLEAFISGGTPPYNYDWQVSSGNNSFASGFSKGDYMLTVSDANGCVAVGSQSVSETIPKLFLPTAFSPNNDGFNDTFGPTTTCPFEFSIMIFNRWGTIVFSSKSTMTQWNGEINGEYAQSGQYTYFAFWQIQVNDKILSEERRGVINLVR
jgi:gliding motility-associated-like protein